MHYKHTIVVLLIFLNSCVNYPIDKKIETKQSKNYFLNKCSNWCLNDRSKPLYHSYRAITLR